MAKWWAGRVRCDVCQDEHIAVIELDEDETEPPAMECAACHHLTCVPVEEPTNAP